MRGSPVQLLHLISAVRHSSGFSNKSVRRYEQRSPCKVFFSCVTGRKQETVFLNERGIASILSCASLFFIAPRGPQLWERRAPGLRSGATRRALVRSKASGRRRSPLFGSTCRPKEAADGVHAQFFVFVEIDPYLSTPFKRCCSAVGGRWPARALTKHRAWERSAPVCHPSCRGYLYLAFFFWPPSISWSRLYRRLRPSIICKVHLGDIDKCRCRHQLQPVSRCCAFQCSAMA